MHAEEDDIPEHLRARKKDPSRTLAIVAIGSVITGALMLMFARPIVIDVAQLRKAVRFGDQRVLNESYRRVERAPVQRQIEPQFRQPPSEPITRTEPLRSNSTLQQPPARQTSFNDHNYTPTGAANVVGSASRPVFRQEAPASNGLIVTGIKQHDRKDACEIFRSGSLQRRDCRRQMDLSSRNRN